MSYEPHSEVWGEASTFGFIAAHLHILLHTYIETYREANFIISDYDLHYLSVLNKDILVGKMLALTVS